MEGRVMLAATQTPPETSHEIFTPDYLWRGPRPVFVTDRERVGYGQHLSIRLGEGWTFEDIHPNRIALVRLYGVTHMFGFDQRYVNVNPVRVDFEHLAARQGETAPDPKTMQNNRKRYARPLPTDTEFRVEIPSNPNLLPPGYYWLFLVSKTADNGVGCPSLGHAIRIG